MALARFELRVAWPGDRLVIMLQPGRVEREKWDADANGRSRDVLKALHVGGRAHIDWKYPLCFGVRGGGLVQVVHLRTQASVGGWRLAGR